MSQLSLMIDLERCIGCKSCEAACKQEHGLGQDEYRNKVLWLEEPNLPNVTLLTVTCQHCERPACLRACPVNPKAIQKDPETGVVSIDESRCTGCGECVPACPYGAMGYNSREHHAVKCDLCADRRARDLSPACASVCPGHAIQFGVHEDLLASAKEEGRTPLDHDHFMMGPGTIYLGSDGKHPSGNAAEDSGPTRTELRPPSVLGSFSKGIGLAPTTAHFPYGHSREDRQADRVVPGGCNICFNACPLKFHLKGNRVVGISGNEEDPVFKGRICPKSQMTLQLYNSDRRLTQPLKRVGPRGSGQFEEVGWDQALDEIAARLRDVRDKWGPESLALFSGTRAGLITKYGYVKRFAQLWGTPNMEGTDPFCSAGKNLAYNLTQGQRVLPNVYTKDDIGGAAFFLYVGDNQAETRPVYFGMVNNWRRRTGAQMVVVDPRLSATADRADQWIPIRSGTDMALGLAMIQHIFGSGLHDLRFCRTWLQGWETWRDFIQEKGYTSDWAAGVCDIPSEQICTLAEQVARADGCMIFGSRGLNQHSNSVQTNRVFMFLAAITGNWGRRGGGYFNMTSEQHINDHVPPARKAKINKPAVGKTPLAWMKAIIDGDPYPIKALITGNNPFAQWPNQNKVRQAAAALDLFVHIELFRNETSNHADYILPAATGIEKGGITRSADDRRIIWNDKHIEPPGQAKSDGWIWTELGKRFKFDDVMTEAYKDTAVLWDESCIDSDDLRGCTTRRLRAKATHCLRIPLPSEDAPETTTLLLESTDPEESPYAKLITTTSGKLEFWTPALEARFQALGMSALPEFYSEREQLVDLPYIEREESVANVGSPFYGNTLTKRSRIVASSEDSPGSRLRAAGYDTELVTGRPPAPHFHSWTHYFWQAQEMWPDLYVQIHPDRARRLGIADGDHVRIETTEGAVDARAWIRSGIRASTVYVPIGWAENQPHNSCRSVNFLTASDQLDPFADQANLKTKLCRISKL